MNKTTYSFLNPVNFAIGAAGNCSILYPILLRDKNIVRTIKGKREGIIKLRQISMPFFTPWEDF